MFNLQLWSKNFDGVAVAEPGEIVAPHFLSTFPSQHPHACTGLASNSFSGLKNSIKIKKKDSKVTHKPDHLCCPRSVPQSLPSCPATPWIQYPQSRSVDRIPCLSPSALPVKPGLHQYPPKSQFQSSGLDSLLIMRFSSSPLSPGGNAHGIWQGVGVGPTHPLQPQQCPGWLSSS